jgi:hypothetical protein
MILSQTEDILTVFDKGIGTAVIAFCGCAAVFLVRRWFRQMDEQAARDIAHLAVMERISSDHSKTVTSLISQHHNEIIEIHKENSKERSDMVAILQSLATSLKALQTSITGMRVIRENNA